MTLATLGRNGTAFSLTPDQEKALAAFNTFLLDPVESVFVLEGYSGCGKSTLVKTILDRLSDFMRTARLINPDTPVYEVALTATTNKAAEALQQITHQDVCTIHSFLSLRVQTDFRTNVTTLLSNTNSLQMYYLLFIDEASYIDSQLLDWIFKKTKNCKIVFIGDPAQLRPIKSSGIPPVFAAGFNGAALTEVVRQADGNPIIELSTMFRNTVNSGDFFAFKPDGHHIQHMSRADFNTAIEQEFSRPDWRYQDSKVLAWTNKCVIEYNQFIRNKVMGDPHFAIGDYAVCNSFISIGRMSLKTDQLVQITSMCSGSHQYGVFGNSYVLDNVFSVFMPKELADKTAALKKARAAGDMQLVTAIETTWIDLRAAYSQTINKAQGSTYNKVFIDLDDIRRCNSGDQIARMMYVGVSRARNQVILTGDLV